jgi:uncharacterized protein YdcH (DUF465 family)
MSKMDSSNTDRLKEHLMSGDPNFRELSLEQHRYEARLNELSRLAYPSDEEQLEEIVLKKKKLVIKDQMHSILLQYEKQKGRAAEYAGSERTMSGSLSSRRKAPERTPDELFPEPRTRLIEAAFAAHAEFLESGRSPLGIDEINAEVAERRGGAREDASR